MMATFQSSLFGNSIITDLSPDEFKNKEIKEMYNFVKNRNSKTFNDRYNRTQWGIFQLLKQEGNKGSPLAQYYLGELFRANDSPFMKNLQIASLWHQLAFKQGYVESRKIIGLIEKEQEETPEVKNKNESLYKYCSFSKPTIYNLCNDKISFSLGENFNDPFDELGKSWFFFGKKNTIGRPGDTIARGIDEKINEIFSAFPALNEEEQRSYNNYNFLFKEKEQDVITLFRSFYQIYMKLCIPGRCSIKEMKDYKRLNDIISKCIKEIKEEREQVGKGTGDPFYQIETVEDYINCELNQPRNFFIEVIIGFYFRKDCINNKKYTQEESNALCHYFLLYFFRKRSYFFCLESGKENSIRNLFPGCSMAMWGYYADSHKGFCIKYKKEKLEQFINLHLYKLPDPLINLFGCLRDIKFYNNNIIYISQNVEYKTIEKGEIYPERGIFTQERLTKLATVKNKNWEHEQEYRFGLVLDDEAHASNGYYTIDCPADAIDSIYFGLKVSKEDKETIKKILFEKNREIQFYQMAPSTDKPFSIEPELEESLPNKKTNVKNHIKNTEPKKEVELATE